MEHIIKYFPVGNADCSLIKLDNGKQVAFDVKADLLKELKRDNQGRPYVDLFISTHTHEDHCLGFCENFYHGDVADYDKDKNKDKEFDELWEEQHSQDLPFVQMIYGNNGLFVRAAM